MLFWCAFSACLVVGVLSADVTFNYVTVMGGTKPVIITSSNSLSDHVPEKTITNIYFKDQDSLPILYTDSISNLLYLETLNLTGHGVREIRRGAFSNLPVLSNLMLDDNELEEITSGVFNYLTNLTRLSLKRNLIKNISASAFDKLHNLSFLFLSNNQLTCFDPNWFDHKPFLFLVEINENLIEEIPDGAFEDFHNSIFLGGNKIANLSREIFGKGGRLNQLSLHDNQIESWDEDLLEDVELNSFDISSNRIVCLEGNFSQIFLAKHTFLGDNPWDCSCLKEIAEFEEWAEENMDIDIDLGTALEECNSSEADSVETS